MMDGQLGSDGDSGVGTRGGRIDWRTGKRMVARDEAFWQGLEIRRCEQGLSIPQYCRASAFGGKLSHRTTSSDVSPRCRFVGMMNSRPRTIVTLTRGFATKPEWHIPELPGMHITKSPQIRA